MRHSASRASSGATSPACSPDMATRVSAALRWPLPAMLGMLAACSMTPPRAPRALLDESTGVTVTAASEPIILARLHSDTPGGLAHDCVTLVGAERDEAGKYTQLLLLYRWSFAANGEARPPPPAGSGRLIVRADAERIELRPLDRPPISASQFKQLFAPEVRYVSYAYLTDFQTLRRIADSHELSASLPDEAPDESFSLWRDGRP